MSVGDYVLLVWAVLTAGASVFMSARALVALERLPSLGEGARMPLDHWPRLSLVVAARNEALTIEAAVETLLAQDYPDLEIVLVNDRSTDGTGPIIDRLAARDPRVRPVHITELPEGWLGKVHALHMGTRQASGEWLLFCDADVHLGQGCLKSAVSLAVNRKVDHLPAMPTLTTTSYALEATYCFFGTAYMGTIRADKLLDPDSDAFAGVGAFNLVRARVLEQSEGLQWLRMEVADDVGIGALVKHAHGRTGLAVGEGLVAIEWYSSVRDMAGGLEKNMFGVFGHYRIHQVLAKLAVLWAIGLGPFVALIPPWWTGAWILTAASLIVQVGLAFSIHRRIKQRVIAGLLPWLGFFLLTYMILCSTITCTRQGGVVWKDTFYPLSDLRELQRVKL